ncbi:MAG: right-handed parallel beta-helix repeat-containing protein, partial [Phycisphaerae bacterium]
MKAVILFIFIVLSFPTLAATYTVDDDGPADFTTIQSAINAAINGDEIIIAPGTYTGTGNYNIDFNSRAITVRSQDPNNGSIVASTIIDCQQNGRGFIFQRNEGPNSVLAGVTIINGILEPPDTIVTFEQTTKDSESSNTFELLPDFGDILDDPYWWAPYIDADLQWPGFPTVRVQTPIMGGFYSTTSLQADSYPGPAINIYQASPVIMNCVISGNTSTMGGAINIIEGSPAIIGCTIDKNNADGITAEQSNMTIVGCEVTRNRTAIKCEDGDTLIFSCRASYNARGIIAGCDNAAIYNCISSYNYGNGISAYCDSSAVVTNCTIYKNSIPYPDESMYVAGGIYLDAPMASIFNCIVYDNYGYQLFDNVTGLNVSYCNIQGGWAGGTNNIDAPPMLTRDCLLTANSPCINSGTDVNVPDRDIHGELRTLDAAVDIGADEFIDSDTDSLPDWWELAFMHDPNIAEPNGNPDGDEYENSVEYDYSGIPTAPGITFYVDYDNGSNNYDGLAPTWDGLHGPKKSIAAAIANAPGFGDTIILMPGVHLRTWVEQGMSFYGKWLNIRSLDPNDPCTVAATVIDLDDDESRAFWFCHGEGPKCSV